MDSKQCFKKSIIGKVPCEWENAKLIDAVDKLTDGSHFSPKKVKDSKFYIATVKDMGQYKINLNSCKEISEQDYVKLTEADCKPEKGDVLFSKDGTMGLCFVYNQQEPIVLLSSIAIIRPNYKLDPYFLKYYLSNASVKEFIVSNHSSGSALPRLTLTNLKEIPIIIPALREQQSIAKILSDLDSKIELNQKMNKTLEAIAQAIFKHWFIDFEFPNEEGKPYKSSGGEMVDSELGEIPKGWVIRKLRDVLREIASGSRPRGGIDKNLGNGIPSIGAENINGLGHYDFSKTKYVTYDFFEKNKKGLVIDRDVLLYKDGAQLGRKTIFGGGFPFISCMVNEHVFILRVKEELRQSYLYFWLDKKDVTDAIRNLNTNSAQPGINREAIGSIRILVPPSVILSKFDLLISFLLDRIFNNSLHNKTLGEIRDLSLPKLISGKIRVPLEEK